MSKHFNHVLIRRQNIINTCINVLKRKKTYYHTLNIPYPEVSTHNYAISTHSYALIRFMLRSSKCLTYLIRSVSILVSVYHVLLHVN